MTEGIKRSSAMLSQLPRMAHQVSSEARRSCINHRSRCQPTTCRLTSSLSCSGCQPALAPRTTTPSLSLRIEGTLYNSRRSNQRSCELLWSPALVHLGGAGEGSGRCRCSRRGQRSRPSKAGHQYQPGLGSAEPGPPEQPFWSPSPARTVRSPGFLTC